MNFRTYSLITVEMFHTNMKVREVCQSLQTQLRNVGRWWGAESVIGDVCRETQRHLVGQGLAGSRLLSGQASHSRG